MQANVHCHPAPLSGDPTLAIADMGEPAGGRGPPNIEGMVSLKVRESSSPRIAFAQVAHASRQLAQVDNLGYKVETEDVRNVVRDRRPQPTLHRL